MQNSYHNILQYGICVLPSIVIWASGIENILYYLLLYYRQWMLGFRARQGPARAPGGAPAPEIAARWAKAGLQCRPCTAHNRAWLAHSDSIKWWIGASAPVSTIEWLIEWRHLPIATAIHQFIAQSNCCLHVETYPDQVWQTMILIFFQYIAI